MALTPTLTPTPAPREQARPMAAAASPRSRALAAALALTAALAGGAASAVLPATAAHADGTATVHVALASDPAVTATAFSDAPTDLVVSGSGFQSIDKGFGGIYLLFGWIDPAGDWRPSAGGTTGRTYQYQLDDAANPAGYQQFISFPGGSTEAQASGGDVAADGTWSSTLTVTGATFETVDGNGDATTVDCLTQQCGVITIGAHGVANKNNETFTPVRFVTAASLGAVGIGGAGAGAASGDATASREPQMTTLATDGAATGGAGGAGSAGESSTTPTAIDASATAGPSAGAGWMIGSGIALAALLGVGIWRLVVWRRRKGAAGHPGA